MGWVAMSNELCAGGGMGTGIRSRAASMASVGIVVLMVVGCAATSKPQKKDPGVSGDVPSLAPSMQANAEEKTVLLQANTFRKEQGLKALRAESKLMDIARRHAANMARKDRYGDTDTNGHIMDGLDPADRVQVGGYVFSRVAENVGWQLGREDPATRMVEDWKKSPGHRKNLLIAEVSDTGVGAAKGRSGKWYFVQLFGKPYEATRRQSARMVSLLD